MDKFVQKERALVSPSSPSREPDIDFNDVFGGPPKRSTSSHESRYSFAESTRRNSRTKESDDDEVMFLPRDPWSGRREMAVFGEEKGGRRKYPSGDFFDDIFKGDEPVVGSPRRASHEPFGSGLMSPSRSLPSRAEPFGSSLPAQVQFSLPAKMTRGMDSPSFSSGNRSQQKYKEPILNAKGLQYTPSSPLYRPSPLSHEVSLISELPSLTIKPEEFKSPEPQTKAKNNEVKKDSPSTEATNIGNQFHFSIYKWASKGVPMLMPLRGVKSSKLKETTKTDVISSFGETDVQDSKKDVQDSKRNVSTKNKVHHAEELKQVRGSPNKATNTNVESVSTSATSSDKIAGLQSASQDTREAQNIEIKSFRSLLGTSEEEGKSKTSENSEQKDLPMKKTTKLDPKEDVSKKIKQRDEKKYYSKREEVIQVKEPEVVDLKRVSKENTGRRKAKGKVNEFVNIFDQEADLKKKNDVEKNRNQSSERESSSFEKADKETSAKTANINRIQVHGLNKIQTPANAAVVLDKEIEESEKQHSYSKTSASSVQGNFSGRKDEQVSNSESHPDTAQDIDDDKDDFFNEDFTVKELTNEQEKPVQGEDNYEDIQTSNDRIRKWSRGKEGNIRSLLSTLQYVLWAGSGWKPVPLVDIIEGNAVKRSYQRAMLCLHPDKLQQKGAADYQKYIAEKVFDILQEAWDQFNSLGLM